MSPAGIPMFYGASEEYSAVAETVLGRLKKSEILNIGVFETEEDIYVLDLTNVPSVPSLFSPTRYQRPTLGFLRSFVSACRSDASLGGDGKRPCSAAYIQN